MEMKRCQNGHFYDQSVYQQCPYCQGASANANVTIPLGRERSPFPAPGPTVPVSPAGSGPAGGTVPPQGPRPSGPAVGPTRPVHPANRVTPSYGTPDEGKTIGIMHKKLGVDPVVGWLVCTKGKNKGQDYRIHTGNNFIGRGDQADIRIQGDNTVSKENQGMISYDRKHKAFYVAPGTGQNMMYLNDEPVLVVSKMKIYDKIEVGDEELMFIPLCGEEFEWE